MNVIFSDGKPKQFSVILEVLLFLLLCSAHIFAQDADQTRHIYKPTGFNSWKPTYLLPRVSDSPGPDTVVRTDFTITMRDGIIIDCLKYVPVRATPPAGGYLTVIMVHGYGDNKNTLAGFCHDQATYGYYTMTYSVRGQGNSGGLTNLISDVEALDLLEIIQWVKNDSLNGSNPSRMLIMGGSQGGLLPMKAACMGGNPVKTLITSVAPPNFASSWIENGSVKMTALWSMDYTPDTCRYTQEVVNMRNWIYGDTKAGWDSLSRVLPVGRDFVNSLPNCQIPVMIEAGWQDMFFNSSGWLDNITSLTCPYTSYLGAVHGHGGEISATEDKWHMNWFNDWFFQWLWDIPTPIIDESKYQYAYTTYPLNGPYWTFVHDSSSVPLGSATVNTRLYFAANKKLAKTFNINNSDNYVTLRNRIGTNYTLQDAIWDEFKGTKFNNKFKKDSIIFLSDKLMSPVKWVGAPIINLDYSSSTNTFAQLNFQIYEQFPNGTIRFINRANYTDRDCVPNQRRLTNFKGQGMAHIFQTGSKIRIKITNLDVAKEDSAFFDGTNPFVLPVMRNGTNKLYLSNNSYIEFPIIGGPTILFNKEAAENTNTSPFNFELTQNFPNPFNPSTMIEYTLPVQQRVSLKVYDVIGREVATLVNADQAPGSYNVIFNASNLSSGVYFYKLQTQNYTDIKKMILVK